ncbi:serine/threonine-protein kinase [Streptomyces bobili]|uniref:serine/threonine-protein kinase n=1 Tax=Streptomyces bobili TaxID=67280 RepID=UPI0033E59E72
MEKLGPGDPQRIGGYRLLGRLGSGGMGQVFLARSDRGRTVAVKLVRPELAAREEFRTRFRHEVRNAQRVGGFWTAPVLDADTEAAVPWVATGYVAGPSLQQVVGHDHGPLPERSVRILAAGLAHALTNIHAAGIVHRDLKPSNVMVTIEGPRVIDFGVARALETVTGDGGMTTYLGDGGLTQTGAVIGSPGFMAPEQVRGDRITPACDVFCLGSVLAYAATGTLPFGSADQQGVHALLFRIAEEEPDLTRVPEGLADLVRACLRKDPAARPTLEWILERTGAEDTVADGRSRDPWLPGTLVAQLGRHAVRLLETENPEGAFTETAPQHSTPPDHVPTLAAPHPAYGYPQQYPAAPPQRPMPLPAPVPVPVPHNPYAAGATAYDPYDPYDPEPGPRRRPRSTVLLVAIAAVVALAAGGTVYAVMNGDDDPSGANPAPTRSASAPPSESADESPASSSPSPSPSPSQEGRIPENYLGTWNTTINTADTRRLTLTQGEVGDTVLRLVADGEAYHCEFAATLTKAPTPESPLTLGPSKVTTGEPLSSCSPGAATEVTLLPGGRLQRLNPTTGEKLTYSRG